MSSDAPLAIPLDPETPAFSILVNFGVAAGRDPTRQEVEELARAVRRHVSAASITVTERYEVGEQVEVCLHEVRIEVHEEVVGAIGSDRIALRTRLVETAAAWASGCVEKVGEPRTLTERLARQAVVDLGEPPSS
jgi:hypothetical protein